MIFRLTGRGSQFPAIGPLGTETVDAILVELKKNARDGRYKR